MATNQYTLGRGEVHFARFQPGTRIPGAFSYIGNTPEFSLTIETEDLDHFSSDFGIREKDESVVLEVNRTGSLITDNISVENVALFFFGDASAVTVVAAAGNTETFLGVNPGNSVNVGATPTDPTGAMGLENVVVTHDPAGTADVLVIDVDYTVDLDQGYVSLTDTGTIVLAGSTVQVDYDIRASTRERVISGTAAVEGALRYKARNPVGPNRNFFMPYIKVTPNGDYALKGDEWQQIPLNLEVLKVNDTTSAIFQDGNPVYA